MFERFTDRSRKVIALANQEAINFGHENIGTEHVLLGLIKEGSGVGVNILKNLDVDLRRVKVEIEKFCKSLPGGSAQGKVPMSPRTKKLIEYAIEEAINHNHTYVGSEHLLLGLLRVQDDMAGQVLKKFGVTVETAREEMIDLLGMGIAGRTDSENATASGPALRFADLETLTGELITRFDEQSAELTRQKDDAVRRADYEKAADLRSQAIPLVHFKELMVKKILETSIDAAAEGQPWNHHYARMISQLTIALIESSPDLAAKLEGTLEKLRNAAKA